MSTPDQTAERLTPTLKETSRGLGKFGEQFRTFGRTLRAHLEFQASQLLPRLNRENMMRAGGAALLGATGTTVLTPPAFAESPSPIVETASLDTQAPSTVTRPDGISYVITAGPDSRTVNVDGQPVDISAIQVARAEPKIIQTDLIQEEPVAQDTTPLEPAGEEATPPVAESDNPNPEEGVEVGGAQDINPGELSIDPGVATDQTIDNTTDTTPPVEISCAPLATQWLSNIVFPTIPDNQVRMIDNNFQIITPAKYQDRIAQSLEWIKKANPDTYQSILKYLKGVTWGQYKDPKPGQNTETLLIQGETEPIKIVASDKPLLTLQNGVPVGTQYFAAELLDAAIRSEVIMDKPINGKCYTDLTREETFQITSDTYVKIIELLKQGQADPTVIAQYELRRKQFEDWRATQSS